MQNQMNKHLVNPYEQLYRSAFPNLNPNISKQQVYELVVNIGQVHNVLGYMLSDIIKVIGNFYINSDNQQLDLNEINNIKSQQNENNNIKAQQNEIKNNNKQFINKNKFNKYNQEQNQKMEIQIPDQRKQKYPIHQPQKYLYDKNFHNLQSQIQQYQYQESVNKKINKSKNEVLKQVFESYQKKQNNFPQIDQFDFNFKINESPKDKQTNRFNQNSKNQKQIEFSDNHSKRLKQFEVINIKDKDKKSKKSKQVKQQKQKTPFNFLFDSNSQTVSMKQIQQFSEEFSFDQNVQINQINSEKKFNYKNQLIKQKKYGIYTQIQSKQGKQFTKNQMKKFNQDTISENECQKNSKIRKRQIYKDKESKESEIQYSEEQYITSRPCGMRKKKQRQALKGSECPNCKAFYQALKSQVPDADKLCECSSRHRSNIAFMAQNKVQNYSQALSLD